MPPVLADIRRAPKVLLHDHLDGGLRPGTVVDLAEQHGYVGLPGSDEAEVAAWLATAAQRGRLELYLEAFQHTVGVMQNADALFRVAAECAQDLAADGVVYAESRYAPEQHLALAVLANMDGAQLRDLVRALAAALKFPPPPR